MTLHQDTSMAWAGRLYCVLLRLYPLEHRHTYGALMTQLFLDQLRDARLQGAWQVMMLCLRMIADTLISASLEHARGSITAPNKPLLAWGGAMLMVVVPALVFTGKALGIVTWIVSIIVVVPIACVTLVAAVTVWKHTRRIPVWGLPLLGMIMTVIGYYWFYLWYLPLSWLFPQYDTLFSLVVSVLQWGIFVGIPVYYVRRHPVSWAAWILLGVYALGCAVVGVLYSIGGMDSSLAFSFARGSFFEYLFPVVLGLLLARRQGVDAVLFAVSGLTFVYLFWSDFDHPLVILHSLATGHFDGHPVVALYETSWQLMIFVIAPLWMVRARTFRSRVTGVLIPIFLALASQPILRFIVFPPDYSDLLRYTVGRVVLPMLAIGIAFLFYRQGGDVHPVPPDSQNIEQSAPLSS